MIKNYTPLTKYKGFVLLHSKSGPWNYHFSLGPFYYRSRQKYTKNLWIQMTELPPKTKTKLIVCTNKSTNSIRVDCQIKWMGFIEQLPIQTDRYLLKIDLLWNWICFSLFHFQTLAVQTALLKGHN